MPGIRYIYSWNRVITPFRNWPQVFCDNSTLVTLNKTDEVSFHLIGTNDFHVKAENERFTAAGSRCYRTSNLKTSVVVWQTTSKHCTKKRAARVARLFFFIQLIVHMIIIDLWRCSRLSSLTESFRNVDGNGNDNAPNQ